MQSLKSLLAPTNVLLSKVHLSSIVSNGGTGLFPVYYIKLMTKCAIQRPLVGCAIAGLPVLASCCLHVHGINNKGIHSRHSYASIPMLCTTTIDFSGTYSNVLYRSITHHG